MRAVIAAVGIAGSLLIAFGLDSATIDLRGDWLTAQAIVEGIDPNQPQSNYADDYGVVTTPNAYHPRTPGALILAMPLAPIPLDVLATVGRVLLVVEAVVAAWLMARFFDWEVWKVLAALPVYFCTLAGVGLVVTGGRDLLILACILGALLLGRRERDWLAGLPLAIAMTLKLWPWALIVAAFLAGRRRFAYAAAGGFVAVNLVGLLLPGVSALSSARSLSGGSEWVSYGDNGSLASVLVDVGLDDRLAVVLCQLALIAILILLRRFGWESALITAIPFAVFLAPLAWPQYLTSVLLAVLWSRRTPLVWFLLIPSFAWMLGIPVGRTVTLFLVMTIAAVMLEQGRRSAFGQARMVPSIDTSTT